MKLDIVKEFRSRSLLKSLSYLKFRLEPKRSACDEEVAYLKKNVGHLRFAKRRLEEKLQELESRCTALDQRKQQYKVLYEKLQEKMEEERAAALAGGGLEITSLHQQLSALSLLKD